MPTLAKAIVPVTAAAQRVPLTFTYAGGVPPDVLSQVQNLKQNLANSVKVDTVKVCELWRDPPDTFYPYGQDVECRQRHVRHDASDFRKGVQWTFQNYVVNKQKAYADAIIDPLVAMLATEAIMTDKELRQIVGEDYYRAFRVAPPLTKVPLFKRPATGISFRTPGSGGGGAPLEEGGAIPGTELAVADDKMPWLLLGVGVVVLGGVAFFVFRRKER